MIFIKENAIENIVSQNGGHFVQGEMSLTSSSGSYHALADMEMWTNMAHIFYFSAICSYTASLRFVELSCERIIWHYLCP